MEFGDSYIFLFGFKFFEPMVVLTNFLIFLVCIYYYRVLIKYKYKYSKEIALFVLFMGVSSCFGSAGHTIQHQFGVVFFRTVLFISHTFNLASVYFCFRAAYTFFLFNKEPNRSVIGVTVTVTLIMLILATITGTFIFLKVPAAVVMVYFLIIHYLGYRKKIIGTGIVVLGILVSFLSIIIHSFRISISEWFNHKDIAHVIIAVSLIVICQGVKTIVLTSGENLEKAN